MKIFKNLLAATTYVRIKRNHFVIRNVDKQKEIGVSAKESFTTRRLLVGEFSAAKKLLSDGFKQLHTGLFIPSPIVVIQPLEMVEDGLSEVEERAIRELAARAGARKVIVWVGHELSDQEVLDMAN